MGDNQTALEYGHQALQIWQEVGGVDDPAKCLLSIGRVQISLGRLSEAAKSFQRAKDSLRESEQPFLVLKTIVGFADVALAQGDLQQAQDHAEEILVYLKENLPDGSFRDPFRVYLTCYQVLQACNDPRAAAILTKAHDVLQEQAKKIDDDQSRRSFLENITIHREIVAAYRELNAASAHQRTLRLPSVKAPQGRPLRADEHVDVTWTLSAPEDEQISGKVARRRQILLRLLNEATQQGAIPRDEDLAAALDVSLRTIRRDLAALRAQGHTLPSRRRKMAA
jgi:tetratricopeptide (TPR) repeat protein